ncbi:hypothetical protein Aperf_G00000014969 [Anoplocephala perfoliata]
MESSCQPIMANEQSVRYENRSANPSASGNLVYLLVDAGNELTQAISPSRSRAYTTTTTTAKPSRRVHGLESPPQNFNNTSQQRSRKQRPGIRHQMWRNWLSRSPTPSRHERKRDVAEEEARCRSATMPRPRPHHEEDNSSTEQRPSSSTTGREKKGRFDFFRQWRTLSRSLHSLSRRQKSPSPEKPTASQHSSDGSCTPTNEESKHKNLPLELNESDSTGTDETTPTAEDADKSLKVALAESRLSEISKQDSELTRISRKDLNKGRQQTSKPSLFGCGRKTPEKTHDQTYLRARSLPKNFRAGGPCDDSGLARIKIV